MPTLSISYLDGRTETYDAVKDTLTHDIAVQYDGWHRLEILKGHIDVNLRHVVSIVVEGE